MDIKEYITKAVNALKGDQNLLKQFKSEPIKVVENILGIDLPDEIMGKVVDGIKAKLNLDNAAGILGSVAGLFGKK